jgi:hypothetical protein
MCCSLLAKLYKKAIHALNITVNETHLWTDSSIALTLDTGSIKQMENLCRQQFALIQKETVSATWRHVPTQSNPADLISRRADITGLSSAIFW